MWTDRTGRTLLDSPILSPMCAAYACMSNMCMLHAFWGHSTILGQTHLPHRHLLQDFPPGIPFLGTFCYSCVCFCVFLVALPVPVILLLFYPPPQLFHFCVCGLPFLMLLPLNYTHPPPVPYVWDLFPAITYHPHHHLLVLPIPHHLSHLVCELVWFCVFVAFLCGMDRRPHTPTLCCVDLDFPFYLLSQLLAAGTLDGQDQDLPCYYSGARDTTTAFNYACHV